MRTSAGIRWLFPLVLALRDYSRINHDGTPIQYAVTVGPSHHTLQFLSEAGSAGLTGAERMRVNRDCITTVAQRLHAEWGALIE